jgi:hypothetical protein
MTPNQLTRAGLLLNGVGGVLLLICHFPFSLPSGDPASITAESAHWGEFWKWANAIGSVAGLVLVVLGIAWQTMALKRDHKS